MQTGVEIHLFDWKEKRKKKKTKDEICQINHLTFWCISTHHTRHQFNPYSSIHLQTKTEKSNQNEKNNVEFFILSKLSYKYSIIIFSLHITFYHHSKSFPSNHLAQENKIIFFILCFSMYASIILSFTDDVHSKNSSRFYYDSVAILTVTNSTYSIVDYSKDDEHALHLKTQL